MRILIAALVVSMLGACAGTGESRSAAVAEREIQAATAVWAAAYDSRDPARIVALYDPEAALWGTTSPTLRATPATVADYFKDAGKRPSARVTVVEQYITVVGDTAVNSGTYTFADVREGKGTTSPARFTFVFRKRDGRWMILAHHSSRVPAP